MECGILESLNVGTEKDQEEQSLLLAPFTNDRLRDRWLDKREYYKHRDQKGQSRVYSIDMHDLFLE